MEITRRFLSNSKKLRTSQGQRDLLGLDLVAVTLLVVDVAQADNQLFERPERDRDEDMRAEVCAVSETFCRVQKVLDKQRAPLTLGR